MLLFAFLRSQPAVIARGKSRPPPHNRGKVRRPPAQHPLHMGTGKNRNTNTKWIQETEDVLTVAHPSTQCWADSFSHLFRSNTLTIDSGLFLLLNLLCLGIHTRMFAVLLMKYSQQKSFEWNVSRTGHGRSKNRSWWTIRLTTAFSLCCDIHKSAWLISTSNYRPFGMRRWRCDSQLPNLLVLLFLGERQDSVPLMFLFWAITITGNRYLVWVDRHPRRYGVLRSSSRTQHLMSFVDVTRLSKEATVVEGCNCSWE